MEQPRKRASVETSLRSSTESKKSKPNASSLSSSGHLPPQTVENVGNLCKTVHENRSIGKTIKTEKDFTSDGNYISTESSGRGVSKTIDVPSISSIKVEENADGTGLFTEQIHTAVKTEPQETLIEDKGAQDDQPEDTKGTKHQQNQKSKPYSCVCGKSYSRSSHLNRHQKTHVGNIEMNTGGGVGESGGVKATVEKCFSCVCGKSYTTIYHLHRHQKTCPAGSSNNLERDPEEHLLKPYVCACGKRYTCSSHLYRHQRTHLDGPKETVSSYICDCGKTFSRRSDLHRHQKTHALEKVKIEEHEGDSVEDTEMENQGRMKPYVCICGKSYTSSSHLYRHQRTHQDVAIRSRFRDGERILEKPYKCECGKSYTCTSHLYRHQRTHKMQDLVVDDMDGDSDVQYEDSGEKPYQCECGKSFILWFSLMVHKRVHCKAQRQSPEGQDGS
ncbi:uncharacterized protein ACNLHF_000440 isoform 1-T2 [Anomaloglossus baeobatrachus]|uniref:uncharacterized protein LOC142250954 n=1 Tax=Anomaloglossus baeobatrachus TaxID=238106 RepID=UPI003F4FAF85